MKLERSKVELVALCTIRTGTGVFTATDKLDSEGAPVMRPEIRTIEAGTRFLAGPDLAEEVLASGAAAHSGTPQANAAEARRLSVETGR